MTLTGKAKDDFEKWVTKKYSLSHYTRGTVSINRHPLNYQHFPDSMQWGVLVDFFDSVGLYINIGTWKGAGNNDSLKHWIAIRDKDAEGIYGSDVADLKNSREEARKAAIEKANELYN